MVLSVGDGLIGINTENYATQSFRSERGKSFLYAMKTWLQPQEVIEKGEKVHVLTVSLLGLHSEYLPILSKLGSRVGTVLEGIGTMASRIKQVSGIPSVRVVVITLNNLPTMFHLPVVDGGWIEQRVVYNGLPIQSYYCRSFGHLAKVCPKKEPLKLEAPKVEWQFQRGRRGKQAMYVPREINIKERILISSSLHTSNPYDLLHEEEQETTFKVVQVEDVGRESPRLFQPNADIQKVECSAQHNLPISNQQVLEIQPIQLENPVVPGPKDLSLNLPDLELQEDTLHTIRNQGTPKDVNLLFPNPFNFEVRGSSHSSQSWSNLLSVKRTMRAVRETTGQRNLNIRVVALSMSGMRDKYYEGSHKAIPSPSFIHWSGATMSPQPIKLRVNFLVFQRSDLDLSDGILGFSFPLQRTIDPTWSKEQVSRHIQNQVVDFSQVVGFNGLAKIIETSWVNADVLLFNHEELGEGQLSIKIAINMTGSKDYVFIYDDSLAKGEAIARAHKNWRILRERISANGNHKYVYKTSQQTRRVVSTVATLNVGS